MTTHPKNAEYQRRWKEKRDQREAGLAAKAAELSAEVQRLKSKLAKKRPAGAKKGK
jgi:hypothetical protein